MLTPLQRRRREPELMDQPGLDERQHAHALHGLRRINAFSGSGRIVWSAIEPLARTDRRRTWRVLDLASGAGDVAIDIAARAAARRLSVQVDGWDVSGFAVRHATAQAAARGVSNVCFFECDVLTERLPAGYDVIMCSLFLHHLPEEQAVELLRRMSMAAGRLVLVNDLRRTMAGYLIAQLACRLLTRSPVVRVDGPRSVRAAFSIHEIRAIAHQAGLCDATVRRRWPWRLLLSWSAT